MPGPSLNTANTPYYGGGQVPYPVNALFGIVSPPVNNAATAGGILYANTSTGDVYYSYKKGAWTQIASTSGAIFTLTGDSGGAISPSAGNITLAGTANQITTTGSGSSITWSLPSAVTFPGSAATTTSLTVGNALTVTTGGATITAGGLTVTAGNITATAGNLVATAGNLNLNGAASKINLNVATGASASAGHGTLTSGVLAVTTSAATNSSLGFANYIVPEATPGILSVSSVAGTLTITSTDATDSTSTVQWFLIN